MGSRLCLSNYLSQLKSEMRQETLSTSEELNFNSLRVEALGVCRINDNHWLSFCLCPHKRSEVARPHQCSSEPLVGPRLGPQSEL